MGAEERDGADAPLVHPHLVRFLKERPKLIGGGTREEILAQLEENIARRRVPDTVAERAVSTLFRQAEESTKPVARGKVKRKMEKANQKQLDNL